MKTSLPMREKSVDRVTKTWFVFGVHEDGSIDVNDGEQDVFEGLPAEVALKVIQAHDEFREKLYGILCQPQEDKQ